MTKPHLLPEEDKEPRGTKRARSIITPYLFVGVGAGLVGGLFAIRVHHFLKDEASALFFMGSADVALLAVVLTATAVVAGFLDGFFGRVTYASVGVSTFFFPFVLVARVSAAGALVSFGAALNVDSHTHETLKAGWFGLAAFLTAWAVVATAWLISAFTRKAGERRRDLTKEEQAIEEDEQETAESEILDTHSREADVASTLGQLAKLHDRGVLTAAEFTAAKASAIGGRRKRRIR